MSIIGSGKDYSTIPADKPILATLEKLEKKDTDYGERLVATWKVADAEGEEITIKDFLSISVGEFQGKVSRLRQLLNVLGGQDEHMKIWFDDRIFAWYYRKPNGQPPDKRLVPGETAVRLQGVHKPKEDGDVFFKVTQYLPLQDDVIAPTPDEDEDLELVAALAAAGAPLDDDIPF
jgi:hypothetical protein